MNLRSSVIMRGVVYVARKREKKLNIGNSDRKFNINLMFKSDIENKIKVNILNEKDIEEGMDILNSKSTRFLLKDDKEYILYQEKYTNDNVIKKVIDHGGKISYYTNSIVPYYVIKQLSMNLNSEVIFLIRDRFTDRERENVEMCHMATKVIIDYPVMLGETNPFDALFSLHDLKANVDDIQISFPILKDISSKQEKYYYKGKDNKYRVRPESKYHYFRFLQNSLSIWAMNIYLMCDCEDDYTTIQKYIDRDKPGRRKSRKQKVVNNKHE